MKPQLAPLQPHQRIMCDFAIQHPFCGLFLPMGFGKSLVTLEMLYEVDPPGHVLVIGPKPVVRATWQGEIDKFSFPFRTRSLIVDENGRKLKRADRLALYQAIADGTEPPAMWFLNREMVTDLVENLPKRGKATVWPFPTVVVDEAQAFKSYSAKRFKALAAMRPAITRMVELSGTPTPNGMEDLWPLVYLLDGGQRLGAYITHYREKYFYPDPYIRTPQGYPAKWHLRDGADSLIYDAVSDIVVSMRNIASSVPPMTLNVVRLSMNDSEWALYRRLAKDSVLDFGEAGEVVAANAAVLQAKLLQLASGALYLEGDGDPDCKGKDYVTVHSRKLDAVCDIVSQAGSPVLVAYWFRSDKELLMSRLSEEGLAPECFDGSPEMVSRWNAGDVPVMLVQPASAGHGLNLQQGGHTLVWYTMPWSLEAYLQTNARLHRQGQNHPVMVHLLMMSGTVDEKVADALERKNFDQAAFLDAVHWAVDTVQQP